MALTTTEDNNTTKDAMMMQHRCDFYDRFLRPHEGRPNTCWTIMMLARRKYWPGLRQREAVLCRDVLRAPHMTQRRFLQLLELVEFKARAWIDFETGEGVPRNACVCYISANALDEKKAYFAHFDDLCRTVKNMAMNHQETTLPSVLSGYKNCLEKSSFRDYVKLDVDTKDPKLLAVLADVLASNHIQVEVDVETRGGCHLLVACGQDLKALYALCEKVLAELGQQDTWLTMEPPKLAAKLAVPGMGQSEFTPRLRPKGESVFL